MIFPMISRIAQIDDLPAVAALVNSAYRGDSSRRGWTTEADLLDGGRTDVAALRETIETPGQVILLLFKEDLLVACVYLKKNLDRAYLGMLSVRPDLQAAGIGKHLMQLAEAWVVENWKSRVMEMSVIHIRTELIAWYERRGYRNTGHRGPFPWNDSRFGIPKVDPKQLEFVYLEKTLS